MYDKELLGKRIIEYLIEEGPSAVCNVAGAVDASADTVRRLVESMEDSGRLVKRGRRIQLNESISFLMLKLYCDCAEVVGYNSGEGIFVRERIGFSVALTYNENVLNAAAAFNRYSRAESRAKNIKCGFIYTELKGEPNPMPELFEVKGSREALVAREAKGICADGLLYISDVLIFCKDGVAFPSTEDVSAIKSTAELFKYKGILLDVGAGREERRLATELSRAKCIKLFSREPYTKLSLDERRTVVELVLTDK